MELLCQSFRLSLDVFDVAGIQCALESILRCVDVVLLFLGESLVEFLDVLLCLIDQSFCLVLDFNFFFSLLVFFCVLFCFLDLRIDLVFRQLCGRSDCDVL